MGNRNSLGTERSKQVSDSSRELWEQVGQLADRADNFCCASLLGLPAKVHAEQLALGMADIRDALRALYIEATGDDPWTDE